MANRLIATDGAKSLDMLTSNDPAIWNFFSGAPRSSKEILYAYVAAVYRARNIYANAIGGLPFVITDLKTKEEFDSSENWENKVGFLPNPSELFRLDTLSYIDTNTVYNLMNKDVLGYKTKSLEFAAPSTFTPVVIAGELVSIERSVNGKKEYYQLDDERLVRMWRKDHTTEVLPSPNTIARAVENAAEQILYTDEWITHYYQRGAIPPTLIAMKGLVSQEKKEDTEKSFTNWLRGLGKYLVNQAKIYNAEAMEIQAFGDGVADLKNTDVYKQALANIALGHGEPLSLLLSNSNTWATASVEERQWYKNEIIPFARWLEYEYNEQVYHPIGKHLKYNTSTIDAQQEEDATNAATAKTLNELLLACPTFEIFEAIAKSYLEVSDELLKAAEKYYTDKNKPPEPVTVTTQPDTQPMNDMQPQDAQAQPTEPNQVAKWIPSLDELEELRIWRDVALRRFKKGESLDFEYQPHKGGLPESVVLDITARLKESRQWSGDVIKTVFEVAKFVAVIEQPKPDSDIKTLADSLNRVADAMFAARLTATT